MQCHKLLNEVVNTSLEISHSCLSGGFGENDLYGIETAIIIQLNSKIGPETIVPNLSRAHTEGDSSLNDSFFVLIKLYNRNVTQR